MALHLFENFSNSDHDYRKAQAYWEFLVGDCADNTGQNNEWHRWWPSTYGDGVTPLEKDDKPIFDVMCDRQKRLSQFLRLSRVRTNQR